MTPLILIAGFLGAGKTTLVRELLPRLTSRGLAPRVILNDYENAQVDAATLVGYSEQVTPIAGTCICCGSQEELMHELSSATLSSESVMLLEANGTADTTDLIEVLTADRRVGRYTLPIQVAVVDARLWQERGWANGLEHLQAQTVGFHLVTRLEDVSIQRRAEVLASLGRLAPGARLVDVEQLAEEIASLRSNADSLPPRRFAVEGEERGFSASGHPSTSTSRATHEAMHHFSSVEVALPQPVDAARLRAHLEGLPPEVLRVKGIARVIGGGSPVYFQRTDGWVSLDFAALQHAPAVDTVAVLIGNDLDAETLSAGFSALQRS